MCSVFEYQKRLYPEKCFSIIVIRSEKSNIAVLHYTINTIVFIRSI